MTLAYLAAIRFPNTRGHGIQIKHTIEALMREGVTVTLVVPNRKGEGEAHIPVERIPVFDTVKWGAFGYVLLVVSFALKTLFSSTVANADVVYSRDATLLIPHLLRGRRCVYECHAPTLSAHILVRFVPVVAISEGLCAWAQKHGARRVVYAPDAVDLLPFIQNMERPTQTKPRVVYAGTLYPRKGALVLAAAARELAPHADVVIYGGPDTERKHLQQMYPEAIYEGSYDHQDLPHILKTASLVVIPNIASDDDAALYTSPLKLFEAMASGTPIVASRVPSLTSVLTDDMAYFVIPEDPRALAAGIIAALNDSQQKEKAARALAEAQKYTWDRRAQIIQKFIQTL